MLDCDWSSDVCSSDLLLSRKRNVAVRSARHCCPEYKKGAAPLRPYEKTSIDFYSRATVT
jgi:hypothetical protein